MHHILVTGGSGFVPSHLVESLVARGHKVIVLDNFADAPISNLTSVRNLITVVEGDVRDESLAPTLKGLDTIFHFAANANVPVSVDRPLYDASVNVLGTINMLNLARRESARFFLASSAAVYGEPVASSMDEQHPLNPISPYGISKLTAERYTTLYRQLYGVDATIFRLFNIYGPRQRRYVVYDFARKILDSQDEVTILGNGRQVRSQLFVSDAIHAILTIADKGCHPIYNVGSTNTLNVTELLCKMLQVLDLRREVRVTDSSWDGDIQRLVPNIARLEELNYREQVTHEQGLEQFFNWYLNSNE